MKPFRASSDRVEILGSGLIPVLQAIQLPAGRDALLARHGLKAVDPESYYSQQSYLDFIAEIAREMPTTLERAGEHVFSEVPLPPRIDSFEAALGVLDKMYHFIHRGGEIGGWTYLKTDAREFLLFADTPYPCVFEMGIVRGLARRFDARITLAHDVDSPCRLDGGERCAYVVAVTTRMTEPVRY